MWPDKVSNSGPPALESDVLPTALCSLASGDDNVTLYVPSHDKSLQKLRKHN